MTMKKKNDILKELEAESEETASDRDDLIKIWIAQEEL